MEILARYMLMIVADQGNQMVGGVMELSRNKFNCSVNYMRSILCEQA